MYSLAEHCAGIVALGWRFCPHAEGLSGHQPTRQLNRFESTEIPGKFVAGRLDSTPTSDTLLLLPSGITVSGIQSWAEKLADVA